MTRRGVLIAQKVQTGGEGDAGGDGEAKRSGGSEDARLEKGCEN
jgi:hypothetical protein